MEKAKLISFTMQFIVVLVNILIYAMIARVLISWFTLGRPHAARGRFSQFIHDLTEPMIRLARKLPHRIGMIDLAPLIVILGLDFGSRLVFYLLRLI